MNRIVTIFISVIILIVLISACEKRKDPFSASNKAPEIEKFLFDNDSLKYTKKEPFKLTLKYTDEENQQLTATFKFISGHGDIYHSSFTKIGTDDNSIIFDVPSKFDGKINFIPDTTGKVEIELELSDKVKVTTSKTESFFFDNLPPVAKFEAKLLTQVSPYKLEVDASKSNDPDGGTIESYYWNFDDGSPVVKTGSSILQHSYQFSGTYTVKLKVVDNEGGTDSTEHAVSTENQSPLAILQVDPTSGEAPITISYAATNSTDPDGEIVSYRIDFDDGSSSLDSVGTHTYTVDKNYRVKLTVQDNLGETASAEVMVNVATPPVAVLKVTPKEGPFPLDCLIDGTESYDPQGGKIEHDISIDGSLKYDNIDSVTHTFDAPKRYIVKLVVTNKRNGLTDQAQQAVNVINLNPKADFTWAPENPQHVGTPVIYTSTSTDSNLTDEISYFKWTFPGALVIEGEDKDIVEVGYNPGFDPYIVKLEVWDKYDGYDSVTKTIPK